MSASVGCNERARLGLALRGTLVMYAISRNTTWEQPIAHPLTSTADEDGKMARGCGGEEKMGERRQSVYGTSGGSEAPTQILVKEKDAD